VEVCINGAWGTVCNRLFTQEDADVVCNQLPGFKKDGAAVMSLLPGSGPVFVEGLLCDGSENRILDCNMYAIPLHLVCLLLAVS
jgi:hypothetical protein